MVGLPEFHQNYRTAALNYWRDPDRRSWIIVNPTSIGDTWCVCALAEAFKAAHGGPLTFVMRQGQRALSDMYADVIDRVIYWEDVRLIDFTKRLMGQGSFDLDEPIIAHPFWHGTGRGVQPLLELLRYPRRGGLTLADQFRLMLQLDWDAPLKPPTLPQVWRDEALIDAKAAGVEPGNSVILFPDNNTNPPLPDAVWTELAAELRRMGRKVFTNLAGNVAGRRAQPLAGTQPISVSIRTAIPVVEYAGRFISMSNGLQAVMMAADIQAEHTILIHDFPVNMKTGGLNYAIRDPIACQTYHYVGFAEGDFFEYVVRPDAATPDLIADIARNNPDSTARLVL